MNAHCPRCTRILEYSGERPRFCAYCGSPLESAVIPEPTMAMTDATSPFMGEAGATLAFVPEPKAAIFDDSPGEIAGYRVLREIGRGGMGTVYEAEEETSGRRVALKLIARESITSMSALERFRQEGRLASTLAHPRCVFVLAADEVNGRPYIVMELMPGTTLQDVVEKDGALGVGSAVPRILDVIDGLIESHRLGVIHRDVKPSNCFVDADGRTKIGDFGLSKSLGGDSNLTRTGAFLGTPLYASPEQIKGEEIDIRTDVYSVAATLYYMLTGKPPFRGTDAAATLARIVSEPLEPLRSLRPDVPADLERVIIRGMERSRERRYRSLQEFREALAPFSPGQSPAAPLVRRFTAYLIDVHLTKFVILFLLSTVTIIASRGRHFPSALGNLRVAVIIDYLVFLFSFLLMEGFIGASPGKWLLRLKVRGEGIETPRLRQVAQRTLIFYLFSSLPWHLWVMLRGNVGGAGYFFDGVVAVLRYAMPLLLFVTATPKNGYRGLHEVASRTRVVSLPRSGRRMTPERRRPIGRERGTEARPVGVLKSIGPYKIRGAVRWDENRKVLAAQDPGLGRESWIVLRPRSYAAPLVGRRELARPGRLRWLSGGEQGEHRWDAYVAPQGCPIADLAGPDGMSWGDARFLFADLAEELAAAIVDGTLPTTLSVDQVWVQPDGAAVLVDPLGIQADNPPAAESAESQQARALDLLSKVAALTLEGGRHRVGEAAKPINAAIPLHGREIIDRLASGPDTYRDVVTFHRDLEATFEETTEVDRTLRATQLAIQTALLLPGLAAIFGFGHFLLERLYLPPDGGPITEEMAEVASYGPTILLTIILVFLAGWLASAVATRGGLSLRLSGLAVVRHDGRPVGWFRCLWRSIVVWIVPGALLCGVAATLDQGLEAPWIAWSMYFLAAASLVASVPLALARPDRGVQDILAGTTVVTR